MLAGLIGRSTAADVLKEGLDVSTARTRVTAHRVANATTPDGGFGAALEGAVGANEEAVDLEREMVALADEQIRYEATARLLQKVYAQVRSSVRER